MRWAGPVSSAGLGPGTATIPAQLPGSRQERGSNLQPGYPATRVNLQLGRRDHCCDRLHLRLPRFFPAPRPGSSPPARGVNLGTRSAFGVRYDLDESDIVSIKSTKALLPNTVRPYFYTI